MPDPHLEPPGFTAGQLRELQKALRQACLYVGPVGISEHAGRVWRDANGWDGRLEGLIAELEEYEAEEAAQEAAQPDPLVRPRTRLELRRWIADRIRDLDPFITLDAIVDVVWPLVLEAEPGPEPEPKTGER